MSEENKECPFCGGEIKEIVFQRTGCCIRNSCPLYQVEINLDAWNTRTLPAPVIDALERIKTTCLAAYIISDKDKTHTSLRLIGEILAETEQALTACKEYRGGKG